MKKQKKEVLKSLKNKKKKLRRLKSKASALTDQDLFDIVRMREAQKQQKFGETAAASAAALAAGGAQDERPLLENENAEEEGGQGTE